MKTRDNKTKISFDLKEHFPRLSYQRKLRNRFIIFHASRWLKNIKKNNKKGFKGIAILRFVYELKLL